MKPWPSLLPPARVAEVAGVVIGCAPDSYGFNSHDVLAGCTRPGKAGAVAHLDTRPTQAWCRASASLLILSSESEARLAGPPHLPPVRQRRPGNPTHGEHTDHVHELHVRPRLQRLLRQPRGVSVAGRPLHHIGELFKRHMYPSGWTGGVVFDVGTPTMVMINTAYQKLNDAVVEHVRAALGVAPVRHPGYRLCFRATPHLWGHLPTVTLKFAEENARLVLTPQRLFVAAGRDICLDVQPSLDFTIIGAMQQVDTRFVYDVSAGRIYFAPENACHADAGGHI
ncbi:Aspartic proteinase nepenthesin-1 [Hordeum vulgare]|nr:Aspartic proteinase nepenthesin-1 [Hordeum vulgare]